MCKIKLLSCDELKVIQSLLRFIATNEFRDSHGSMAAGLKKP